jgi:hypothetical protein
MFDRNFFCSPFFEPNKKVMVNVEFTHGQSKWIARKAKQAKGTQEATN